MKGFVEEVVILCRGTEIARHARSYGQGVFVYDPLHYLALIEMKPNALDQAAALQGWDLPEGFQHLRHLLEARMGNRGKREFIQVLRLMEAAPKEIVAGAVNDAIRLGAIGFDAVKQIVLARIEKRPPRLNLASLSLSSADERQNHVGDRLCRALVRERRMSAANKADKPAAAQTMPSGTTSGTPQLLLAHHLKQLKLPTILREYDKVAREAAREGIDHAAYLLRLVELELIDRERRVVERRIRQARFPAVKSLDTFDFTAIPSLNKMLVLELARCEYILRRDNIIALGNSGTGKTHIGLSLGLAACQKGFSVAFTTAAGLVHQLMEARDERRLLKLQRDLAGGEAADHRRTRLCPAFDDGRRVVVRGVQPAIRARLDHRDVKPSLRGMDVGVRRGTTDRRASRSLDPPCPYPVDERRELPPRSNPRAGASPLARAPKTSPPKRSSIR